VRLADVIGEAAEQRGWRSARQVARRLDKVSACPQSPIFAIRTGWRKRSIAFPSASSRIPEETAADVVRQVRRAHFEEGCDSFLDSSHFMQ
jgi:hypothetical protein